MSSPFYTLIICLAYIYVVKILGPNLMQNRKPFQVKKTLLFYNLFQVFFSLYLFYEIGMSGWFTGEYNFRCQPVDYSNKPSALRMLHVARMYYIAKFTEFLDTIFFVLRKKFNQVTTLHVIHHSIMPMSIWIGLKLIPGGHGSFLGLLNSFVHVVMYSYYFLSALGPEMQKYLWWKKYLTTLQLAQFVAIIVHSFQLLFRECDFPKAFVWVIGLHGVMFFILFKNFYDETYKKAKSKNRQS
ncbi:ELO domain containing protein [Asbolus verrucosus]|uniref:Elongation of very long chain fatty acids protein n=1 Tax=Asbolus verrucosus TaxID=1661398 RepID=A0A482W8W2_ASBVE|nr:ELO domain containing protein [Asbolus verrucosus]